MKIRYKFNQYDEKFLVYYYQTFLHFLLSSPLYITKKNEKFDLSRLSNNAYKFSTFSESQLVIMSLLKLKYKIND